MISSATAANSYTAYIQQNKKDIVSQLTENGDVKELTSEEEMAQFKKDFYAEVSKIPINHTVHNAAINVSEEAFEKMKEDPEYRTKVIDLLKRDLGSTFLPCGISSMIFVGASVEDYRAMAWNIPYDNDFWDISKGSHFLKKTNVPKDRRKDYAQEMIDRTMENNRIARNLLAARKQRELLEGNVNSTIQKAQNAVAQYESMSYLLTEVGTL